MNDRGFFKIRMITGFVWLTLFTFFSLQAGNLYKAEEPVRPIREYVMKNVIPVIREERNKLDEKLTASEQAVIETAREQLRELRKDSRSQFRDMRSKDRQLTDEQREAMKVNAEKRKEILKPVKAIADAHEPDLQEIRTRLESKKAVWKEAIKTIREQNQEAENQAHNRLGKGRRGGVHPSMFSRWENPVAFLLMNPDEQPRPHRVKNPSGATLFPNPATHEVTMTYSTENSGDVTIQVLDEQGNVVHQEKIRQNEGNHSYTLKVSDWKPGLYFYKIQAGEQEVTKRFRIE